MTRAGLELFVLVICVIQARYLVKTSCSQWWAGGPRSASQCLSAPQNSCCRLSHHSIRVNLSKLHQVDPTGNALDILFGCIKQIKITVGELMLWHNLTNTIKSDKHEPGTNRNDLLSVLKGCVIEAVQLKRLTARVLMPRDNGPEPWSPNEGMYVIYIYLSLFI